MKTLAELKNIKAGQQLKLVDCYFKPNKYLNIIRTIEEVHTRALRFKGESWWLYLPKARWFKGTEKGFCIYAKQIPTGKRVKLMEYEVIS